jgi:hypothetical protein
MNRRAISSMFAAALVGAALLIGAAGPVAEYVSPSGHVAGSAVEAIGSATQGAGAGKALALATPMPCPGTETLLT